MGGDFDRSSSTLLYEVRMPSSRDDTGRLGGLGALFFVGTLAAIAFYVQSQSVPEEHDVVRKAATVLPQVVEDEQPVALPWQDRLDLAAATLVPFAIPGAEPAGSPPDGASSPTDGTDPPPDPTAGRLVQDLSDGHRILLTLDPVIQDSALQIFRNREVPYAAAVMLDLRDNAVLAFAGHSSMDPEVDPLEILTTAWAPAASTFKLVTASALLDKGAATRATRVCFSGGLHGITDDALRDVPSRDTQCASLGAAIAHSYNLVLGKLALRHLGEDELRGMAHTLLFEQDIDFEFPIERSPAHIPSAPVERAKVATGFWNVDMSPVHAVLVASVFARGGIYQPPHIIARVMGPDGSDVTPPTAKGRRVLGKTVANTIASMMLATTTEGTARASFRDGQGNDYIPGINVAGKTGSLTGKRPPALNYNWFIGFAPADAPEVAVAVLLANTPKWRIKAHYAARRLIEVYQRRRQDIARQRDVRLTHEGVILPQRDPSGALVASANSNQEAANEAESDGTRGNDSKPQAANGATDPGAKPGSKEDADETPLPPVPGPVPPTSPSGS